MLPQNSVLFLFLSFSLNFLVSRSVWNESHKLILSEETGMKIESFHADPPANHLFQSCLCITLFWLQRKCSRQEKSRHEKYLCSNSTGRLNKTKEVTEHKGYRFSVCRDWTFFSSLPFYVNDHCSFRQQLLDTKQTESWKSKSFSPLFF